MLLAVADRVGLALAERAVADELRRTAVLPELPGVEIGGFPFLTQALRGRYERIDVQAAEVPSEQLTVRALSARLTGVQVPLSQALSGEVGSVPVERVEARVLLTYDELSRRSGDRELTVSAAGDDVRIQGSVRLLGQTFRASAVGELSLEGEQLVVTAQSYDLGSQAANSLANRALEGRFDLRIPLSGLPYGLRVSDIDVRPEGLVVRAGARDTVLDAG